MPLPLWYPLCAAQQRKTYGPASVRTGPGCEDARQACWISDGAYDRAPSCAQRVGLELPVMRGPGPCMRVRPLSKLPPAPSLALQIADLIAASRVRVEVSMSVPLEQVARAQEQVASGHTRGKVVMTV